MIVCEILEFLVAFETFYWLVYLCFFHKCCYGTLKMSVWDMKISYSSQ